MENNTFGLVVVTIIGLLYFVGIGSLILSFIYDPKETTLKPPTDTISYHAKVTSTEYQNFIEYDNEEPASVILVDSLDSLNFDMNKLKA